MQTCDRSEKVEASTTIHSGPHEAIYLRKGSTPCHASPCSSMRFMDGKRTADLGGTTLARQHATPTTAREAEQQAPDRPPHRAAPPTRRIPHCTPPRSGQNGKQPRTPCSAPSGYSASNTTPRCRPTSESSRTSSPQPARAAHPASTQCLPRLDPSPHAPRRSSPPRPTSRPAWRRCACGGQGMTITLERLSLRAVQSAAT
jgi:hypothetical protein